MARDDTQAKVDDVRQILGSLDERKLLDILELNPTVLDIEEASMCLSGDNDVFGRGKPVKDIVDAIVSIVTAEQEDDEGKRS